MYIRLFLHAISGDSAYSLILGLLKPYRETPQMLSQQVNFNYLHSSTRMAIENTNSRLKHKWQRLTSASLYSVTRMRLLIRACIVFHNFVLRHDTDMNRQPPPAIVSRGVTLYEDASSKRDSIADILPQVRS